MTAAALVAVAIGLVAAAFVAPVTLRTPNRIWWRLAQALGWVNVRVLLTLFFIVVMTPTGLLMRLFCRSPLRAPHASTNWSDYAVRRRDPSHYEHMF